MFIWRLQIKPEEDSGYRASVQRCHTHSLKTYLRRNSFFCGQLLLPYVLVTKLSLEKSLPSRWLHSTGKVDRPYVHRQIRKFHLMMHVLKKTWIRIKDKGRPNGPKKSSEKICPGKGKDDLKTPRQGWCIGGTAKGSAWLESSARRGRNKWRGKAGRGQTTPGLRAPVLSKMRKQLQGFKPNNHNAYALKRLLCS